MKTKLTLSEAEEAYRARFPDASVESNGQCITVAHLADGKRCELQVIGKTDKAFKVYAELRRDPRAGGYRTAFIPKACCNFRVSGSIEKNGVWVTMIPYWLTP